MGKLNKKLKQLSKARGNRKNFGHSSPQKPSQLPIAPRDHSLPPQCAKRISIPVEPSCITPPQPKKRRFKKKTVKEKESRRSLQFEQSIVKLERKWFAVARHCLHWRHFDRTISPSAVRQITRDMKISEETLRNWVKKALAGKSLLNKTGIC